MNRMFWRALTVSASAILAGGVLTAAPAHAADDITINLVVTNDFHGQIDDKLVQWAATVEQLRNDAPAGDSLFLSAGDNVGDSVPASAAQHDNPTIDVLNLLGLNASAVGNHEFDQGYDDLVNHIEKRADFPILGANVTKADGTPALPASATFTVSGMRVAVIGAVTDTTPQLVPDSGIEGLNFGDPVAAINKEVARLNALPDSEKPQVIVATIHDGAPWGTWDLDQAMADSASFSHLIKDTSPEVDAIITGHTHNTYVFNAPVPGDPSRTRPVIQTGYHGSHVGQIKLSVDPQTGAVTAYSARNVLPATTSDADLVASDPTLAKIADIRDDAVAYAAAKSADTKAAQADYDAALTNYNTASTAAEDAKDKYEAGVTAAHQALASAEAVKTKYDAAVKSGQDSYSDAAEVKDKCTAAVTTGKDSYSKAANIKDKYTAAVTTGKDSYSKAANIKDKYTAAATAGKDSYSKSVALKEQYQELASSGDADSAQLSQLAQQYNDAITAAQNAYTTASGLWDDYKAAITAAQNAYATASGLWDDYKAAITAAQNAYASASALASEYQQDIAAANAAYATAAGIKPDYDAVVATWKSALATGEQLKTVYDAAVATWNSALTKLEDAKKALLALLL